MKRKRKSNNDIPEFLQPLPMIESHFPDDWQKGIRSEISRYKELHSRSKNKRFSGNPSVLDFEKSMEKRRIQALLKSIESLPASQEAAREWVTLNVVAPNYTSIDSDYHVMTAAAIWILDQILEADVQLDDLYRLLPRDDALLDDLYPLDVCDTQFSEDLIASVEYVLRNRNSDIAPLEDDGSNGKRVFTSILAAEGKCHADVPSRNNYESLIALIPQRVIDMAVMQFENCYKVYQKHFLTLISFAADNTENKRKALNAHREKMNIERERVLKLLHKTYDDYKRTAKQREEKPAPLMNPLAAHTLPKMPALQGQSPLTPIATILNRSEDDIQDEVRPAFNRLEQLNKEHNRLIDEFNDALELLGRTTASFSGTGYISEREYALYYSDIDTSILDPLPFNDPFAMCFALLYLIEKDSDIPWLYGSCISMMHEVVESLPWAHYEYDEMEDEHWVDISDDGSEWKQLSIAEAELLSEKRAAFPDWYSRDYRWKDEDRCDARNLAQILYEETGCLMPRNLHRYDRELTALGKYGIRQNKALSMLYCMIALGTQRRQLTARNFDAGYMSRYEEKQETVGADVLNPDELKAEIERLRAEGQQLRTALHSAEKSNSDLRKKLTQQQEQAVAEHRELADLREVLFKNSSDDMEEEEASSFTFPYTVQKSTVVFGGHDTWVKAIKPLLKGDIKFVPREMKIDVSLVRYADVIWIQTNALPHRSYYSIVDTARKYHKPIRYFTFASASKCAEQIVKNEH